MSEKTISESSPVAGETESPQSLQQSEPAPPRVLGCPNCSAPVDGAFCANCGQKDLTLLRPVWSLLEDTMGDLFAFDSRFFKTLGPLFFKPGCVTKLYMQGKRARFVPPFRQYLVVSIIFFLTLAFSDLVIFDAEKVWHEFEGTEQAETDPATSGAEAEPGAASVPAQDHAGPASASMPGSGVDPNVPEVMTWQSDRVLDNLDNTIDAMLRIRAEQGAGMTDFQHSLWDIGIRSVSGAKRVWTDPVLLNRLFADWIPKLMFIMLPFFALLLKLVYIRRKRFYIEHLVFSLHFHAFVFILLTVMVLLHQYAVFSRAYLPWLLLYVPVYLVIAMWRQYDQGPVRVFFKGLIIAFIYVQVMALCLSVSILYGLSQL